MRQFYLRTDLDPDEHIRIISAPKQNQKGDEAFGSQVPYPGETAPTITVT